MDHKEIINKRQKCFQILVPTIKDEFEKSGTVTVRQIRAINPEFDNPYLIRKGFKFLIEEKLCVLEGNKRGSKYVRS